MTAGTLFSELGTETSKTNDSENPMIAIINEFQRLCTCSTTSLLLRALRSIIGNWLARLVCLLVGFWRRNVRDKTINTQARWRLALLGMSDLNQNSVKDPQAECWVMRYQPTDWVRTPSLLFSQHAKIHFQKMLTGRYMVACLLGTISQGKIQNLILLTSRS